MKKLLSVVLVLAMILGSFSMVFATDYKDVKASDDNCEAISVLSGLGVIGGYADGTFRPEGIVTRAEMATMIVNALGIPVKGGAATQFSDVPASHWASGYINYAASVGFIAGYTDGTFQPEKQVSYNEAIAMIVGALGYTAKMLPGTYPGCFINKAAALGILDNCTTTGTIGANRGDIAQMLYDAADQTIGYVNDEGTFCPNAAKAGHAKDSMFDRLGATEHAAVVITPTLIDDADIDISDMLGAYATYYEKMDDAGVIIAIGEVKSEFVTDDWDDLETITGWNVVSGGAVKFTNGEGNGTVAKAAMAAEAGTDKTYAVEKSGAKIKTVYSVQEWNEDDTFKVDETLAEDLLTEIKEDHTFNGHAFVETEDESDIDTSKFILAGVDSFDEIKEDAVVTVYLRATGTTISKIEVCQDVVTGKVTKSNATNDKWTVAGTAYEMSSLIGAKGGALVLGEEYTLYLDYAGDIYDYEGVNSTAKVAVVVSTGMATTTFKATPMIKLLIEDGTTVEIEVKDTDGTYVTAGAWTGAKPADGDLVMYTLDSKGEKVVEMTSTVSAIGPIGINTKALGTNGKDYSDAVVFNYDSEEDEYTKIDLAKVLGETTLNFDELTNADGDVVAILLTNFSNSGEDEDTIYAVTIKYENIDDDDYDYLVTAMYEGKEVALKSEDNAIVAYTTASCAAPVYFSLNADGTIDTIKTLAGGKFVAKSTAAGDISIAAATKCSNGIFEDAAGAKFAIADDATIYVYDDSDEKWSAGKASSLAIRSGAQAIYMFDIDLDGDFDNEYDLVIVFVD